MALTQKQENFCLAYIETGNASEAYRVAYDADGMKPETVNRKAKDVIDNGKIAARIKELRAPVVEKALLTLESHLKRLDDLSRKAEEAGQFGPAIKAEESRGKAAGLYADIGKDEEVKNVVRAIEVIRATKPDAVSSN